MVCKELGMKRKAFKKIMKPYQTKNPIQTPTEYLGALLGYMYQHHHLREHGVSGSLGDEQLFVRERYMRVDPEYQNGFPLMASIRNPIIFVIPANKKEGDDAFLPYFAKWVGTMSREKKSHKRMDAGGESNQDWAKGEECHDPLVSIEVMACCEACRETAECECKCEGCPANTGL
jgi:hypothetical protein